MPIFYFPHRDWMDGEGGGGGGGVLIFFCQEEGMSKNYLPAPLCSIHNECNLSIFSLDLHNSSDDTQPHSIIVKYATESGILYQTVYHA